MNADLYGISGESILVRRYMPISTFTVRDAETELDVLSH
jgi:hypothetical protein